MATPDAEYHPAGYDYHSRFVDLQLVALMEGGELYTATEQGHPVVISDEGTMADFFSEDDLDLTDRVIAIRQFVSEAERDAYLQPRLARATQPEQGLVAPDAEPTAPLGARTRKNASQDTFRSGARALQGAFRKTLSAGAQSLSRDRWDVHAHLLAVGHEDETLYPTLRGSGGARDYFTARGAQWWRSPRTGDSGPIGPTRNLTSSQVACVNLFLPFRNEPALLAAMLRVIDPEIVTVARIEYQGPGGRQFSEYVELEWTGREGTLEGSGSRGAHATSADAFLIGITANGDRRAFLLECKYTESYGHDDYKGGGEQGEVRRARYADRYASPTSVFSGAAPLDEVLYEPFYQIVRLGLLGDMMREDGALDLKDACVVVVCPTANTAYRDRVTSSPLKERFGDAETVEEVARRLWKQPEGFRMTDPAMLVAAVGAASDAPEVRVWRDYMAQRYGW